MSQWTTLTITRHGGPLAAPALNARASWTRRDGLLVRLSSADGTVGLGEASPLPGFSADTLDECHGQLAAVHAPALPHVPSDVPAALDAAGVTAPAARFALETALYDALARRARRPLWQLLRAELGAPAPVPLSALVADLDAARAAAAAGIRTFKVKAGPSTWRADLALIAALRAEHPTAALRIDLNGSLEPACARARLRELAAFRPDFVEEPVATDALARLGAAPVPIAADESLARLGAWPALAEVCRVLVLKPTFVGGLHACLRLARDGAARGLACTVSHALDGPVALTAAAHLALAMPAPTLAAGLTPHAGLAVWPAPRAAAPIFAAAEIVPTDAPGLGLELAA
jgi:o-succinylbenzoate synthase